MRTYTKQTNLDNTERLLQFAVNNNCEVITEEGRLNDFHIIFNTANIAVNKIMPRKYIICFYKFQNMYSNTLWQTHTDDINLVKKMAKDYRYKYYKDLEEI